MNYIWISSFIADVILVWLYFRHSDFTPGKHRTWLKVVLAVLLIPLYYNSMFTSLGAAVRVIWRAAIYFVWVWLGEEIPWKGSVYSALFYTAVYTAFQNVFFGPFLADLALGHIDILGSHILSQIVISLLNIVLRFVYFAVIGRLLPFSGMIGTNISGIIFAILINIVLTYSKTAVVSRETAFGNAGDRSSSYFILLQLALLLALIAFEVSRRRTIQAASLDVKNTEARALLETVQGRQKSEDAIRSLRHDLKNHAISMQLLLDKGDTESVKNYLDSFLEAAKNPAESYHTGSDLLDRLLKQKLGPAKDAGIDVSCTLDFRNAAEKINNFDLCVLMGNVLDNAVEACLQQPADTARYIKVTGGPAANCQLIRIENSSVMKNGTAQSGTTQPSEYAVTNNGGLPVTTKADKNLHGFGLRNVKAVLDRYDGSMTIEQANGSYSISMLISVR